MKRKILLVVLVVVLAVVTIGCGGGGRNLDGRWELVGGGGTIHWIEFSGRNYTIDVYWLRISSSGTFSISDDQIEFVGDDGNISVLGFSRTENTITINGEQFARAS